MKYSIINNFIFHILKFIIIKFFRLISQNLNNKKLLLLNKNEKGILNKNYNCEKGEIRESIYSLNEKGLINKKIDIDQNNRKVNKKTSGIIECIDEKEIYDIGSNENDKMLSPIKVEKNDIKIDGVIANEKGVNGVNRGLRIKINGNKGESILEARKQIFQVKKKVVWIKLMIVNIQRLNKQDTEYKKKLNWLFDVVSEIQPEILFIIDAGENGAKVKLMNYRLYDDGRNFLWVRCDIKDKVICSNGLFKMPSGNINLAYVRPMEKNNDLINEVIQLIREKKFVGGDLNLKSNKKIREVIEEEKIDLIIGEETGQIIALGRGTEKSSVELLRTPSDHKTVIIRTLRKLHVDNYVKLVGVVPKRTKEVIECVFNKGEVEYEWKTVGLAKIRGINSDKDFTHKALDFFLNNDSKNFFKIYNWLYKANKKEPFLGTWIPEQVVNSLKNHYKHNEMKNYPAVDLKLIEQVDLNTLEPKKASFSKALTIEGIVLRDIDQAVSGIWYKWNDDKEINNVDIRRKINNFWNCVEAQKRNLFFQTFFLKKGKAKDLNDVNDVRIISIVNIFIKIWENLIYNNAIQYLVKAINGNKKYQYGGIPGASTYECMFIAQNKYRENKGVAMIYVDISKGFDCVNWSLLEKDFEDINDINIRAQLLLWLNLVMNTDTIVNDKEVISKTRGLGMGLSLAPAVFEFYANKPIQSSGIDLDKTAMFVDDLCSVISNPVQDKIQIENLIEEFRKRDLIVNKDKSVIISTNKEVEEVFKEYKITDKEKYLGVSLRINSVNKLEADNRIIKWSASNISIPHFIAFGLKKRIYEGAIWGKMKYSLMMVSISNKTEMSFLWENIWIIYKQDFFTILSYNQLILICFNVFKLMIDLQLIKEIRESVCDVENKQDRIDMAGEFFRERLLCGKKQVDEIIEITRFEISDPKEWNIDINNLKIVCSEVQESVRAQALNMWLIKKRREGIKVPAYIVDIIKDKFFKNFPVVQNIMLRHIVQKGRVFTLIHQVMKQLMIRIQKDQDLIQKFELEKEEQQWSDEQIGNITLRNQIYDQLDAYIERIWSAYNDKKYKRILVKILILIDSVLINNVWKNRNLEEMVYYLNLRMYMSDSIMEKYMNLLENEEDNYTILEDDGEEMNNVISVDGSFNKNNGKIGSGIVVRYKSKDEWKEEYYYIKCDNTTLEGNNVSGEMMALLNGLVIAQGKEWNTINIIFDYLGLYKFVEYKWSTNGKEQSLYNQKVNEIRDKFKLKLNWYKVKSHTKNRLNDIADKLAKVGAGMVKPEVNMIEISEPVIYCHGNLKQGL